MLRKVGIRAVGKDQCPATLRVRGKKEMKAPQTAGSAAFYLYGMNSAIQNRQIIDLSRTAFGQPVPVIRGVECLFQRRVAVPLAEACIVDLFSDMLRLELHGTLFIIANKRLCFVCCRNAVPLF